MRVKNSLAALELGPHGFTSLTDNTSFRYHGVASSATATVVPHQVSHPHSKPISTHSAQPELTRL